MGSCGVSYWLCPAVSNGTLCFVAVVVVYRKGLWPRLRDLKVFVYDQISHWYMAGVSEEEEEDSLDKMLFFDLPEVIFRKTELVKMMMDLNWLTCVDRLFEGGELGQDY